MLPATTRPKDTSRRRRRQWLLLPGAVIVLVSLYQIYLLSHLSFTAQFASGSPSQPPIRLPEPPINKRRDVPTYDVDPTRGIIMALHDRIVPMGVSLIRELRCLGNREIIQVYHCFPEELSEESRRLLTRDDNHVDIIDVCSDMMERNMMLLEGTMRTFQSYWVKPLAVVHTNLTEVVLVDADVILVQDPAVVRTLAGYNRTGTTFFYDRVSPLNKFFNRIVTRRSGVKLQLLHHMIEKFEYDRFDISGMEPSDYLLQSRAYKGDSCHEQDSSMVAIDKSRAGKAVEVLRHIIFNTRFQYRFSWGDKEAFWLAYEFAHQPYFFTPWGLALVNSVPNDDLGAHPQTMCGSMAHYIPSSEGDADYETPQILYVNGKALLDPFPADSVDKTLRTKHKSRLFNANPTHVSARYRRSEYPTPTSQKGFECVHDTGTAILPESFRQKLMRRRIHYFAAVTQYYAALDQCHEY
ncbi:hypothetical protein Poli38472_008827 [Pythium oligandrum]|uniref:Nucleotide-diphospho-sugar transferase n=1 Tax=Pythium oligandrum TaxID=41045 RepID=A0A8K1C4A0_PYTOL|nr:hypothetical protein Poli38472_008827 [Pythium oligandrum]|eukprot:TMW56179.1 hypothetical protein Poli38472_008827 [Pythium oligandrum]